MEIHRSYYYYESVKDDTEVEEAIRAAAEYGDGFEKNFQRLRHDGYTWNHKKVYRVYKKIHFNKRSRLKKRLPKRVKEPLEAPLEPNKTWSMDFVSDKMENGRTFRVLNILDDSNREAVAQEISMSMPADRVIAIMEKVIFVNGKPECIRTDNGPEFISEKSVGHLINHKTSRIEIAVEAAVGGGELQDAVVRVGDTAGIVFRVTVAPDHLL